MTEERAGWPAATLPRHGRPCVIADAGEGPSCLGPGRCPILVVDDNAFDANVIDFLFRRSRYPSRSTDLPARVLADAKMPRMGGFEALRAIRE